VQVSEPATDLAVAVAIASSIREQPVPNNMAFVGELGASIGAGMEWGEAACLELELSYEPCQNDLSFLQPSVKGGVIAD
jgi:hypothetical protein